MSLAIIGAIWLMLCACSAVFAIGVITRCLLLDLAEGKLTRRLAIEAAGVVALAAVSSLFFAMGAVELYLNHAP